MTISSVALNSGRIFSRTIKCATSGSLTLSPALAKLEFCQVYSTSKEDHQTLHSNKTSSESFAKFSFSLLSSSDVLRVADFFPVLRLLFLWNNITKHYHMKCTSESAFHDKSRIFPPILFILDVFTVSFTIYHHCFQESALSNFPL